MTPSITTNELKELLDSKKPIIILDVRNQHELQYGQISKDQILIPLPDIKNRVNELEKFKEEKIIVYCRSGGRSRIATEFLLEQGFKNPINLTGGILAWSEYDNSITPY